MEDGYGYKHMIFVGVHPHRPLNIAHLIFNISAIIGVFLLASVRSYLNKDLNVVQWFSSIFLALLKYIALIVWRKTIVQIEKTMEKFWRLTDTDDRVLFLLQHLKRIEKCYKTLFNCGPLVYGIKPFLVKNSTIFDCYVPPYIPYPIFYVFELYTTYVLTSALVAFHITVCYLIISVVVQFRLVNMKLNDLSPEEDETVNDVNSFTEDLRSIIEYQQFLMRYVKDINKLLTVPLALLMIGSIATLCLSMHSLSNPNGTIVDKSKMIIVTTTIIVEFFLIYGFPAQLLMDESTATAQMVYSKCKWYLPNLRFLRQDFTIMIVCSQRDICIRAGNYHVLNNETILLMLKTAYSFYTFLQKVA